MHVEIKRVLIPFPTSSIETWSAAGDQRSQPFALAEGAERLKFRVNSRDRDESGDFNRPFTKPMVQLERTISWLKFGRKGDVPWRFAREFCPKF